MRGVYPTQTLQPYKGMQMEGQPVTLLSPLTPSKKGADALYIGILSP